MALTPAQVQTVRATVPLLQTHGDEIARVFYHNIFVDLPKMYNVFNKSHQDSGHQAHAVAAILFAYARNIDDLGVLSPAFQKICHIHASMFVRPDQYDDVGYFLMRAFREVLPAEFAGETASAWDAAYRNLAGIFMGYESKHYEQGRKDHWDSWTDLRIVKKVPESNETTSFYLEPLTQRDLPLFHPGQFITIKTEIPTIGYRQSRQYSLSDAPGKPHYRISVKRETGISPSHPGYVSNILHDSKQPGDILRVSHPQGDFFLDDKLHLNCPIVILSAGVGITPMLSMLNYLLSRCSKQKISFVHGARNAESKAFHAYLCDVAAKNENLKYVGFLKDLPLDTDTNLDRYVRKGRVSVTVLDPNVHLCLDDCTTQYFVCGPETFMRDVQGGLVDLGVDLERVHKAAFGAHDLPGWDVKREWGHGG